MSKHHKRKKKNKKGLYQSQPTSNISQSEFSQVVESKPTDLEKSAEPINLKPEANRRLKRDLIRIFILSAILVIILIGGVIVQDSSSWYQQGADGIYKWLGLGS